MSRRALIERVVRELASYERPSASEGERRAAEWIADELREAGCRDVRVEEERAHGGYWWPLGLLNVGPRSRRARAAAAGAASSARPRRRRSTTTWAAAGSGFAAPRCRKRPTWNVVAEAGDPDAARTIVFLAHHDAAHSGLVFHPGAAAHRHAADPEAARAGGAERADLCTARSSGRCCWRCGASSAAALLRVAGTAFTLGAARRRWRTSARAGSCPARTTT